MIVCSWKYNLKYGEGHSKIAMNDRLENNNEKYFLNFNS